MSFKGQIQRKSTTVIRITGMMLNSKCGKSNSWNPKWKRIKRKMKLKKKRREE